MKRALAWQRLWPHRDVWEPAAHHGDALVAFVGITPRIVLRSVDALLGGWCTDAMSRVDRSIASRLGWPWTSPRGQARWSPAVPRASCPILGSTKDFVDQSQIQLQGVGDLSTGAASRLQRLDARKRWRINRGAPIGEAEGLPGPPALGFRGWFCGSDVLHPPSLPRCCTCLALSPDLHNPVAVRLCIIGSILAQPSTDRPSRQCPALHGSALVLGQPASLHGSECVVGCYTYCISLF